MNICSLIPEISANMKQVEIYLRDFCRDVPDNEAMSAIMASVLAGKGKGIRPALVLICAQSGSATSGSATSGNATSGNATSGNTASGNAALCRLAALVELTHTASLIHDDIVDDALLRRGVPTVQARFGKDMAVYAGDYILSRILYLLMDNELIIAGKALAQAMTDMCRGELAQYVARFDTQATVGGYLDCIMGKTASLFAACCEIGATEGGCDGQTIHLLRNFGRDLGMLFQLRDDLLDFTSTTQREGKPTYSDFSHGVYTLPVLHSFCHPRLGGELRAIADKARLGSWDNIMCNRMCALVEEAGGVLYTRQMMGQYATQAQNTLAKLPDTAGLQGLGILLSLLLPGSVAVA